MYVPFGKFECLGNLKPVGGAVLAGITDWWRWCVLIVMSLVFCINGGEWFWRGFECLVHWFAEI